MLTCLHGLTSTAAIAQSLPSSPFFSDGILWVLSGNVAIAIVVDICCMPANYIRVVFRTITIAKMILLAYSSSLSIDWLASLPRDGPHGAIQLSIAALILLRRQHHRKRLLGHKPTGLLLLGKRVEQGEEEISEELSIASLKGTQFFIQSPDAKLVRWQLHQI